MAGRCLFAPELAIKCHIPQLVFQSSIKRQCTKIIDGKSLTHLYSSSMECRRKTTHPSQSKTTHKTWNQGSYVGQIYFLGCYFICTVGFTVFCVYCLGRQGYLARTVAGLNSVDQTGLDFAAILLPLPPEHRDYWRAPLPWALSHWFYTAFMAWQPQSFSQLHWGGRVWSQG